MTWDVRKADRERATELAEQKRQLLVDKAEAAKSARLKKRAEEESRRTEDLHRRQELARCLSFSAGAFAEHWNWDTFDWDWSLTAPVALGAGSSTDCEHLFDPEVRTTRLDETCSRVAARVDSYKPKPKERGRTEAQVPGSVSVLTPQQLNSQKQNLRRARTKAAEKTTKVGKAPTAAVTEPGRLLNSVAPSGKGKERS